MVPHPPNWKCKIPVYEVEIIWERKRLGSPRGQSLMSGLSILTNNTSEASRSDWLLFSVHELFPLTTSHPFPKAKQQVNWSPEIEPSGGVEAQMIGDSPGKLSVSVRAMAHRFVNNCGVVWWADRGANARMEAKEELQVIACQRGQLGDEACWQRLLEHSCQGSGQPSVPATGSASPTGESPDREALKHNWVVSWNMQSCSRPRMKC